MEDDNGFDPQSLEDKISDFWSSKGINKKSSESRRGSKKFFIARTPISAKDHPNWSELYSSTVYDVFARFKNLQHLHVRNGLGLDPLNSKIEKLSMMDQEVNSLKAVFEKEISEISSEMEERSEKFLENTSKELHNLGLWIPSEFDYKTTSGKFVDSVWWSFKELMDNGLLIKKMRPVRWCPDCKFSPSASEISIKQEKSYKIYVKIPLASGKKRYFLLELKDIWMLPAALTIAVNPDLEYAVVKIDSEDDTPEQLVMLKNNLEKLMNEININEYEILNTIKGEELDGLTFRYPLADKIPEKEKIKGKNARKVIISDKVDDDGTGFVLFVPPYKTDHWEISDERELENYNPIMKNGYFDGGPRKNKYSGLSAPESESIIIDDLENKNLVMAREKAERKIEICDACQSRLIRYPIRGWFFESSQIEERFYEELDEVTVIPTSEDIVPKDWLISRDSMWGTPFPRWECRDCGNSFIPSDRKELSEISDYEVSEDLRPSQIMNSKIDCTECEDEMVWEKKVLDPMFVHACSPWAQLNYPHNEEENSSWWPSNLFLGMKSNEIDLLTANLSLSLALFDEASFEKFISLGSVSSDIEYKNVESLVSKNGYDSLRLYLLSDKAPWIDRKIRRSDLEFSHQLPRVIWNLKKFFKVNFDDLKMNLDNLSSSSFEKEIIPEDRWVLSRLERTKKEIIEYYEKGKFDLAIESLEKLILDDIAQSYIKRCRTRLEENLEDEHISIMRTLYLTLASVSKLLSPISPFMAEYVYQSLNEDKQSVFMEDLPESDEEYIDQDLEIKVNEVKDIVDEIMQVKRKSELPEKWPLRKIVYKAKNQRAKDIAEKFAEFIKDNAIVRDIQILGPEEEWDKIIFKAEPNREEIADSYTHWVGKIESILKQKSSEKIKEGIDKGSFEIGLEGRIIEIDPEMVTFKREIPEGFQKIDLNDQEIFVDLDVTEEIWEEETVKEIILRLKSMRQDLGLSSKDEIEVYLDASKEVIDAIEKNRSSVEDEVKARVIRLNEVDVNEAEYALEWDVNGESVNIGIKPLYREKMINYYSSISGLDMKTAELLYESGYTSIDSISDVNPSQLTSIKDIEIELAKDIMDYIKENEIEDVLEVPKEELEEAIPEEDEKEEVIEEEEVEEEVAKELPENISKSSTYLIEEKTSDRSFKLLKEILSTGEHGLCVTRDYPEKVKKKYDLEDIEIIWLSNVDREDVIRPKSLEKLSLALENFLARTGGVILLKGLEYVITNNDFRTVLNLIQSIKDQVAINESILLIPVNPSIIEKYQMDQLSGVVDSKLDK